MGRRLIFGDLHGSYRALLQCLERSRFNPDEDDLYCVGDIADGYPDTLRCLLLLRSLKRFHPVLGNHDVWLQNWLAGQHPYGIWESQGGYASILSFERAGLIMDHDKEDLALWMSTWPYVVELEDSVIMHGGPGNLSDKDIHDLRARERSLVEPAPDGVHPYRMRKADTVLWDRSFYIQTRDDEIMLNGYMSANGMKRGMTRRRLERARRDIIVKRNGKPLVGTVGRWSESKWLFTGHTERGVGMHPFVAECHRFVNLDTGAGSYGRLTIMDMDSFRYWQSDPSQELYPGYGPEHWKNRLRAYIEERDRFSTWWSRLIAKE